MPVAEPAKDMATLERSPRSICLVNAAGNRTDATDLDGRRRGRLRAIDFDLSTATATACLTARLPGASGLARSSRSAASL
jgi:hypothetical protein